MTDIISQTFKKQLFANVFRTEMANTSSTMVVILLSTGREELTLIWNPIKIPKIKIPKIKIPKSKYRKSKYRKSIYRNQFTEIKTPKIKIPKFFN